LPLFTVFLHNHRRNSSLGYSAGVFNIGFGIFTTNSRDKTKLRIRVKCQSEDQRIKTSGYVELKKEVTVGLLLSKNLGLSIIFWF